METKYFKVIGEEENLNQIQKNIIDQVGEGIESITEYTEPRDLYSDSIKLQYGELGKIEGMSFVDSALLKLEGSFKDNMLGDDTEYTTGNDLVLDLLCSDLDLNNPIITQGEDSEEGDFGVLGNTIKRYPTPCRWDFDKKVIYDLDNDEFTGGIESIILL